METTFERKSIHFQPNFSYRGVYDTHTMAIDTAVPEMKIKQAIGCLLAPAEASHLERIADTEDASLILSLARRLTTNYARESALISALKCRLTKSELMSMNDLVENYQSEIAFEIRERLLGELLTKNELLDLISHQQNGALRKEMIRQLAYRFYALNSSVRYSCSPGIVLTSDGITVKHEQLVDESTLDDEEVTLALVPFRDVFRIPVDPVNMIGRIRFANDTTSLLNLIESTQLKGTLRFVALVKAIRIAMNMEELSELESWTDIAHDIDQYIKQRMIDVAEHSTHAEILLIDICKSNSCHCGLLNRTLRKLAPFYRTA